MVVRQSGGLRPSDEGGHFAPSLLYTASKLYYEEDATQAEIAVKLHTSRATVSRLLSEARRQGIVRIEVIAPGHDGSADLAARVSAALGLQAVHISGALPASTAGKPVEDVMGSVLAPAVSRALAAVGLVRGDILLVSSGRTMYEVAQFDLPNLPASWSRRPWVARISPKAGIRPTRSPAGSPSGSAAGRPISSHPRCRDLNSSGRCSAIRPFSACCTCGRPRAAC